MSSSTSRSTLSVADRHYAVELGSGAASDSFDVDELQRLVLAPILGIDNKFVVGACALVPEGKEIPPRSLVVGAPARVVRTLSDEHMAMLRDAAAHYVEKITMYRELLQPDPR